MAYHDLVSIIIPAHNAESTIARALESCFAQNYESFEVCVCVDHCNDGTELLLKKIGDKRLKVTTNFDDSGAANARNAAISLANGRYLAFLDADDEMLPDRLRKQVEALNGEHKGLCYGNYYVEKNDGSVFLFRPKKNATYSSLLKTNFIGCSTVMVDRNVVPDFHFPNNAPKREDVAAWLDTLQKYPRVGVYLDEAVSRYHVGESSVSSSKKRMIKYQWLLYRKTLGIAWIKSIVLMFFWAWNGFWKYRLKRR